MNRVVLEQKQISQNLLHKISISQDEEQIFLNVDLMHGKFTIEQQFRNNFGGMHLLENACSNFDSEDKILKYLKIGDNNGSN